MDISVPIGDGRFNFRAAVVLMDRGRVLLHKSENDEHWALPGGRVAMQESTEDTAVREMMEELEVKVDVERLLWFTENFFVFEGEPFHEIAVYYLVRLSDEHSIYKGDDPFAGKEADRTLIYQWIPLDFVGELDLQPVFLETELHKLPENPRFITIRDEK